MAHIHEDGLRIRFATGYGEYEYSGFRQRAAVRTNPLPRRLPTPVELQFDAFTSYAEVLIGYLKRFGDLTAKVFVGAAYIDHRITPFDDANDVQGDEWGAKAGVELWYNVSDTTWASLNANYTTAHNNFAMRSRLGYRVLPTLSIGPEAGIHGYYVKNDDDDLEYTRNRGGVFARYEWAGGEISAAGGVSVDIDEDTTPYGNVNWITRF